MRLIPTKRKECAPVSKNNSKLPILLLVAIVIIAALGFYMYQQNQDADTSTIRTAETSGPQTTETFTSQSDEITDDEETMSEGMNADDNSAMDETDDMASSEEAGSINVSAALSERSIGSADAPLVIREHSSFTCGHCGDFHKNVFDQIKTTYIDTGKARLIFTDFPLNGPALHASMIARCLPQDRYFDFVDLLFKTQDKWAYETNYVTYLRQNAALAGLSSAEFDACLMNDELKNGVTSAMREAQQKYSINSTPTFVFNEDNVHTGSRSFEFYKDVIEKELAEAGN